MANIRSILETACERLYQEQKDLIDMQTHERTIAAYLAEYLRPAFPELQVDSDSNRGGNKGESKRSRDGRLLIPDLIIHKRGSIEGPNIAAIQIKGFWNKEDRQKDEADLHDLWNAFKYQYLYRLELGLDTYDLILVSPPVL
jgi:hypothetical protein